MFHITAHHLVYKCYFAQIKKELSPLPIRPWCSNQLSCGWLRPQEGATGCCAGCECINMHTRQSHEFKEGSLFPCTTLSFVFREFIHSPRIGNRLGLIVLSDQWLDWICVRWPVTLSWLELVCTGDTRATENKIEVIICDFTNCKQCPSWWYGYFFQCAQDFGGHTGSLAWFTIIYFAFHLYTHKQTLQNLRWCWIDILELLNRTVYIGELVVQ